MFNYVIIYFGLLGSMLVNEAKEQATNIEKS